MRSMVEGVRNARAARSWPASSDALARASSG